MKVLPVPMLAAGLALLPLFAQAEFPVDGKTGLELRNLYSDRDYHQPGASQPYSEEWAQGFLLRYESGYIEGLFGLGVDMPGLLGARLDSLSEWSDNGLLSYSASDRHATYDYSSLGLTAKLRVSYSTLRIGILISRLPVMQFNDIHLHPQTPQGELPEVNEIDGLALQFGQLRQIKQCDSTNTEDLGTTRGNKHNVPVDRYPGSDHFNFAGGAYRQSERLGSSYYYADLEDFYRQHYLGVQRLSLLVDDQSLESDVHWVRSTDEGDSRVDNRTLNALFTYRLGGHVFGFGYQHMSGGGSFAYLIEADPYLVNFVRIDDLVNKDERFWQLCYDYDFTTVGLPGPTFVNRYLRGEHIDLLDGGGCSKGQEQNTDIAYLVQSEPSKNLGIKLRSDTFRSDFSNDIDETRLIVSYALLLW